MIFISLDIETFGLNEDAPIVEIAMILADLESQTIFDMFHRVLSHTRYNNCEIDALAMHSDGLIQTLASKFYHIIPFSQLGDHLEKWWDDNLPLLDPAKVGRKIVFAGKNVGSFDLPRLEKSMALSAVIPYHHRTLDPAMLYMRASDVVPPSLDECLRRAGICGSTDHTALGDAQLVVDLLFHHFRQTT